VTRNSKERRKMSTGSAWRRKASARRNRPPATRQPSARQVAGLGHRRAVAGRLAPCLVACAWRWDPSARRLFSLMCQVTLFLLFSRRETHLWYFGGTKNTFGELGGVLGLVGTAPSSSLYLFLSLFFHF